MGYNWDKNAGPYFEVGILGVTVTDEPQTRCRLGVAYSF
ncbi:oligogalacturonate-specific porin KdgM family protein [Enterobacter intestinihominis]